MIEPKFECKFYMLKQEKTFMVNGIVCYTKHF